MARRTPAGIHTLTDMLRPPFCSVPFFFFFFPKEATRFAKDPDERVRTGLCNSKKELHQRRRIRHGVTGAHSRDCAALKRLTD